MAILCKRIAFVLCYLIGTLCFSFAQEAQKDTIKEKKGLPEIKDFIKSDAECYEGLFNVYVQDEKYYLEIDDETMKQDFVTIVSIIKGSDMPERTMDQVFGYAGDALSHKIIRFEKGPKDKVFLKRPSYGFIASDTTLGISTALKNSSFVPIMHIFDVKAKSKNSLLLDITAALTGDNEIFALKESSKKIGLGAYQADRSYVTGVSCYKNNIIFRSVKSYGAGQRTGMPTPAAPKGTAIATPPTIWEIGVSIASLPDKPMQPRYEDSRVGYFVNPKSDFGANPYRAERKSMVSRWRLEPKPEDMEKYKRGELVEPVKPIVFYIDKNTPAFLQPYFIEAVNAWQPSFEKAGFKNAIIGKMEPTPEEDPEYSMEDSRYSVISYKASLVANAYGPHMADPRTGEILCAHIGIFHNVMNMVEQWYFCQAVTSDPRVRQFPMPENVIGEVMRFVVTHEVGHSLGLRHNFAGSSNYTVEQIRDPEFVKQFSHSASIMDYARMNYVAQPEDKIDVKDLIPRIGPYDDFAIEWGYRYYPEINDPEEESKMLMAWVTEKRKNPFLKFGSEMDMLDPRFQAEDLGDNSVVASELGMKNLQLIAKNLEEWTAGDDENNTTLRKMYTGIQFQYINYIQHVLKNIGGRYNETVLRSEDKVATTPVSFEQQKAAMVFLNKYILNEPEWLFRQKYVGKLKTDIQKTHLNWQLSLIQNLLPRTVLLSVHADMFGEEGNYTVKDLFEDMDEMLFTEYKSGKAISTYRRNFQSEYVRQIFSITRYEEIRKKTDVLTLFTVHLENIAESAKSYAESTKDEASKIHAQSLANGIQAWLKGEKSAIFQ